MDRYTFFVILLNYNINNRIDTNSTMMLYTMSAIRQDYKKNKLSKIEYDTLRTMIDNYLDSLINFAYYSVRTLLLNTEISEYDTEHYSKYIEDLYYKDIINLTEMETLLETSEILGLINKNIKNEVEIE